MTSDILKKIAQQLHPADAEHLRWIFYKLFGGVRDWGTFVNYENNSVRRKTKNLEEKKI